MAGSDATPYLVPAALHAAGAHGISHGIEPTETQEGSTYARSRGLPESTLFPRSFQEAIDRFRESEFARELWSDDFVEMYGGTRQAQADEFAGMVSEAERRRFLELT